MQTTRVISNISYNSIDHFEGVITDLTRRGIIDWAYWVLHKPDKDDMKEHIHCVMKPSRRVDTSALAKEFAEVDVNHQKPLGVTSVWRFTNSIDDWLLYAVHDVPYLMSKGQYRNLHYSYDDLRGTDYEPLRNDWNSIDRTKYQRLYFLQEAVTKQTPFAMLVQEGIVPISQRAQYEAQYNALMKLKYKEAVVYIPADDDEDLDFADSDGIDGQLTMTFEPSEE